MSTYRSIFSLASSATNVFSRAIVGTSMMLFGFSANSLAASSNDIALSYEAGGACYCTSAALSSPSASTIVPTPIGGQSIGQICKRIGEGPGHQGKPVVNRQALCGIWHRHFHLTTQRHPYSLPARRHRSYRRNLWRRQK